MVVFIGVMGHSGRGKTTLIEKIVSHLVSKGLTVGAIKHSSHQEFDLSGKDTRRIREAGAEVVVGISRKEIITLRDTTNNFTSIEQLQDLIVDEVDVIVLEGFRSLVGKDASIAKIILAQDLEHLRSWLPGLKGRKIAVLENTDSKSFYRSVPLISRGDLTGLLSRIEKELVPT
ncbi:MAG: molybdopterin-guanine dinucleotide biosynthesis protein B [Nitrososphaerales archaeon]